MALKLWNAWSCVYLYLLQSGMSISCLNVSKTNDLYTNLLENYNRKLLPLNNQSDTVNIGVYVYLLSINTFDELSGELSVTVIFNFTWKEERISWSPEKFGGKTSLLFSPEDIWTPKSFVRESFESLQEIGNGSEMLRITHDGIVVSTLGSVLKVTCPVDVTFFPFDIQKCTVTLTTLTVRSDDVKFYSLSPSSDTSYWASNSQWRYLNSSIKSYAIPNGPTGIIIDITLKRRSEFYIIYIVVPLVFLGGINNLVFYMPANSGERSSVAITAFLSFAVYMQIINNNVPQSSSPIAYIYYYLMFLLLYSSYIMFACIVSMRIYDRKGKVFVVTKYLVILLRCMWCKRKKKTGKVIALDRSNSTTTNCEEDKQIKEQEKCESANEEVTWMLVGKTFDVYCSCFNFLVYWTFTGATFVSLYTNAGIIKSFSVDDIGM